MNVCKNCGHQNKSGASFCVKCGLPLAVASKSEIKRKSNTKYNIATFVIGLVAAVAVFLLAYKYLDDLLPINSDNNANEMPELSATVEYEESSLSSNSNQVVDDVDPIEPDEQLQDESVFSDVVENAGDSFGNFDNKPEHYAVKQFEPFYGIWCGAGKSEDEVADIVKNLEDEGFTAYVFVTTDWSNLNKEKWYVVTAGIYYSEAEAEANITPVIMAGYKSAYIKYSGDYLN